MNLEPLSDFFRAIRHDQRLSVTHIGIYAALLQFHSDKGFINPIEAYRHEIMLLAKISAPMTYHRCIKDLDAYGYLRYHPSKKRNQRSKIYFCFEHATLSHETVYAGRIT